MKLTKDDSEVVTNDKVDELVKPVETPTIPPKQIPEIVTVHATAVISDCQDEILTPEYGESLRKFLFSEDHMTRNIQSFDTEIISSRKMRTNLITHCVSLRIHVRTSGLWDSPRKYIWKHFSDNEYTKANGSKINLVKIHVKT